MTGVWLRPPRSPGRSGPPLHRDRIVAAAIDLLDRDGVAGLTMRRLAERLGAGSTTLYWHVTNKDDVLDLALDQIFGEVALPEPSATAGEWRGDVEALLLGWRAAMLRHPWSAALIGRPLLGPNVLTRTEFLQSTLRRAGLVEPDLSAATHALANYVIGAAVTLSSWQQVADPESRQAAREHLAARRDRYPTLAETGHLDDRDEDDTFRRGLAYLLDGLPADQPAGSTAPARD
ncbi:TetR/AcrR family transcriptional regulator C-terminal domain-containing protein [Micromonospora sp. WMMD1102]|uniref:TetR/AcrR family transcriptional regulator n=1 Tax=Micromonospora sp. WMMD1102 TaxID=3016105 RepID=UPI002414D2CD|nr:TetR/AcrR family transcriptional regulator C-terminal domain-containing protein [Micromonospora sp. WMMD1102]MDG4790515.1 TetR/AcrR family transcriptional regulator C-terminal domain-containing protein [Micromonospora sp. WMMD1102]